MRKILILLFITLTFNTLTIGQYSINKKKYDRSTYIYQPGDPYKPGAAGFASLVIPGLGQALCGETGRGLIFFGSSIVFTSVIGLSDPGHGPQSEEAYELALIWLGGMAVINTISMVDASRVAKVNNLAWRDKSKSTFDLKIYPSVQRLDYAMSGKYCPGISLKVSF